MPAAVHLYKIVMKLSNNFFCSKGLVIVINFNQTLVDSSRDSRPENVEPRKIVMREYARIWIEGYCLQTARIPEPKTGKGYTYIPRDVQAVQEKLCFLSQFTATPPSPPTSLHTPNLRSDFGSGKHCDNNSEKVDKLIVILPKIQGVH